MAQKGPKKDIKRAKIELKDDPSIDSRTSSYLFDKTSFENRDQFISSEEFKKICTSNKSYGDAFSSIFQIQLDFAHVLIDVISELTNSKKEDKDKSITTNNESSSNFDSIKLGKGILAPCFRLERIEKDIMGLLNWNKKEKTNSNKSSFVKSSRTSPPLSARVWETNIKRSSVPQVINEAKIRNLTEESSPKNILPLTSFNEKTSPSTTKNHASLQLSLGKIIKNSPKKSPNTSLTETSKWLSSKLLSPQPNKFNKASVSPLRKAETQNSNPSTHRDLKADKTPFSEYLLPQQKNIKTAQTLSTEQSKNTGRSHQKTPSAQQRVPSLRDNSQFERKLSTKPMMGELAQKDLAGEESPYMEVTNDEAKLQSRETTNLLNDTDRTFRTTDLEERTQKVTNTDPVKQKAVIKELFKEEMENYPGGIPKANEGGVHQKKFLIDAKWLRTWRDYVNFDVEDEGKGMFDMKSYSKPAKIINKILLKNDLILDLGTMSADLELKDNLLEHHDFEAIPQKIFDQLARWYGCDFEISRFLRPDPFRNNKLFLDLYPNRPNKNKQFDNTKPSDKNYMSLSNTNSENKVIKEIISSNLTTTNAFKKKK